jgi:hypothetical protein
LVECSGEDATRFFGGGFAHVEFFVIGFNHLDILDPFFGLEGGFENVQ